MEEEQIMISKREYEKLLTNCNNYKEGMLASKKREKELKNKLKEMASRLKADN